MDTQFFVANELAALTAAPVAHIATLLANENNKARILIFGHVSAFIFSLLGLSWAMAHLGVAHAEIQLLSLPFQFEAATSWLLTAITFISAVIVTFSDRYLAGDRTRLSFLRLLSLLSCVSSILSTTDSLAVALFCWISLSFGLWCILRLRAESRRESWLVLSYHLVSDSAFLLALFLIFAFWGSQTFSELKNIHLMTDFGKSSTGLIAGLLLVLAFSIKSALFPFHKWLLATLSAPTPLSGLLHAGVVNISAILAWRLMPVLNENQITLLVWGLLSILSAILGTLSMSAQPDVKRRLVYSTVGQMGFMSLQCAIGMPGTALFHLLTHGLFKCHMFLQSGGAVSEGLLKRRHGHSEEAFGVGGKYAKLAFVAVSTVAICAAIFCISTSWTSISAAIVAAALLCSIPAFSRVGLGAMSMFWTAILIVALVSTICASQFDHLISPFHMANAWLLPAFLMLALLSGLVLLIVPRTRLVKALYVHSLNGFYLG